MVLGQQHVQLDPDIVFEHLWPTFDWSFLFSTLLIRTFCTKKTE